MDATEQIKLFEEFLSKDKTYFAKILNKVNCGKNNLVVDFKHIMRFNTLLADMILDNPEETLKAFDIAAEQIGGDKIHPHFQIRLSNAGRYTKIPINRIRSRHIDKLVTVEGIIKQKSDVKGQILSTRFECPSCGNVTSVLQTDERKFKEPSKCGCGRKGKFRKLSSEKVDVYTMSVEEPTEMMSGGTKLSQIKVLCKKGLANSKIERLLYQGMRVEITGILKELMVMGKGGNLTARIDWYLDANYIKTYDDNFVNIEYSKEDIKEFKELSKRDDWLYALSNSIFYDLEGYKEETIGIILQMFSGVGMEREGMKIRGNFHILLVGDPGAAKSSMLKIASKFAPKAMYVAGTGISGAGITASVVKDELIGGYTCEAGPLILCNNGLVCIDELDKVHDDHKKALHEPLSDETVSINKASVQVTMVAQTAVLAAANPKHGTYSDYDTVFNQIDLSSTLINRFDLVYTIRESKLTKEDDYKIARKILGRATLNEKDAAEFSREFIKKYISYARTINPMMSETIQEWIARKYQQIKELKRRAVNCSKDTIPVTARNIDGMRRIIEAVARSRLHKNVTKADAQLGYEKLIYSLSQLGIDPESGDVTYETIDGNKSWKKKDVAARLMSIIRESTKGDKPPMDSSEIREIMKSEGLDDEMLIDEVIGTLKKNGDIFEPRNDKYKVI